MVAVVAQAVEVPTKVLTVRIPAELFDAYEELVEAFNDRLKRGSVTRTELVIEALQTHLPKLQADLTKSEKGEA